MLPLRTVRDGGSYSGLVPLADVKAMEGIIMTTNTYNITGTPGFSCTSFACFHGSLIVGDDL